MISFPPFPATPFLTFEPPNYEQEWIDMIRNIILASVILLMVTPSVLRRALVMEHRFNVKQNTSGSKTTKNDNKGDNNNNMEESKIKVPFSMKIRIYLFYMGLIVYFLCSLPNNTKTARHVYIAPLLHEDECQQIIDIAFTAAGRLADDAKNQLEDEGGREKMDTENVKSLEKLLEWPTGWRKDRKECKCEHL